MQRIPVGRRFSDTLYIAPGVSSGGQVGEANPSMSGGSGLENQYVVDGVNITNAGYGALGSYSIVFGSLGNGVPFDFIKETQSQDRRLRGGVRAVHWRRRQRRHEERHEHAARQRVRLLPSGASSRAAYDQVTTVNGTVNITATRVDDAGVEAGGPVVRESRVLLRCDRSAVAANHIYRARGLSAPQPRGGTSGSPDRGLRGEKAPGRSRRRHRLDASFFGDPAVGENGPQRYTALLRTDTSGFSRLDQYGGHNQTVRYEGAIKPDVAPRRLVRARQEHDRRNSVGQRAVDCRQHRDAAVRSGGIGFFEVGNSGVNWQYQAKATNVIRRHSLRYGVEYENIDYSEHDQSDRPDVHAARWHADSRRAHRSRSIRTRRSDRFFASSARTPATCATRDSTTSACSCRTPGGLAAT